MAKFLINNGKPTIIYKDSIEWERAVNRPLDRRGRPIELPYLAEQKRQSILDLGINKGVGEAIELPCIVSAFECGDPEYKVDPKDPKRQIVDRSKIRKYPEWKPKEVRKFTNELDAIKTMKRLRFIDECDEEGKVIKKNREGAEYHELVGPKETEQILKTEDAKWKARVKDSEKTLGAI